MIMVPKNCSYFWSVKRMKVEVDSPWILPGALGLLENLNRSEMIRGICVRLSSRSQASADALQWQEPSIWIESRSTRMHQVDSSFRCRVLSSLVYGLQVLWESFVCFLLKWDSFKSGWQTSTDIPSYKIIGLLWFTCLCFLGNQILGPALPMFLTPTWIPKAGPCVSILAAASPAHAKNWCGPLWVFRGGCWNQLLT